VVARFVVGLRDIAEVEDKLRMRWMRRSGTSIPAVLEDCLDLIIAQLPFDEETQRLFQLVIFEGRIGRRCCSLLGGLRGKPCVCSEVGHYIIF